MCCLSLQVPFLSVGGELGWREVVSRGVSELSGEFTVEDVRGEDGELYRRLVFLKNAGLIQSESRLIRPEGESFSGSFSSPWLLLSRAQTGFSFLLLKRPCGRRKTGRR